MSVFRKLSLRRVSAVALVATAGLAVAGPAFAAPTYPPSPDSITVSTTSAVAGGSITVSAKTFEFGSDVDVTTALDGTAALTAASFGGGRAATAFVPTAAGGTCETGSTCTVVASSTGVATATVALTKAGSTNITLSGLDVNGEPLTQTVAVTVRAPAVAAASDQPGANDPGGLATTGSALVDYLVIALALLTIGAVIVATVGRRPPSFPMTDRPA